MNVERLNGLSIDALYALADKMGLDLPIELERVFVVEALLEAFEEDSEERKASGDAAVHIEEKKYSGSELDEIDASLDAAPCIESRYNETVVHVIARDPEWAFVFWDVKDDAFDELRANPAFSCLFLRVVKESVPEGKTAGSFEVVVGEDDDRWYLHLPDEGCSYHVDLYARLGNRSRLLAHSAVVRTPRALMAGSEAPPRSWYAKKRTGRRDSSQRSTGCCLGAPRLSKVKSRTRTQAGGASRRARSIPAGFCPAAALPSRSPAPMSQPNPLWISALRIAVSLSGKAEVDFTSESARDHRFSHEPIQRCSSGLLMTCADASADPSDRPVIHAATHSPMREAVLSGKPSWNSWPGGKASSSDARSRKSRPFP